MRPSRATFRDIGSVTIVDLSGSLMLGTSTVVLRQAMSDLLARQRSNIILNFRSVTGIDSAGVGEVIASFKTTKNQEGRLKLLNPPQKVSDMLALTRLSNIFEIYTNETAAIRSFEL
jgi:anti-anti-sigma factor